MSNLIQKIRDRVRAFNKHTFNPMILKSAGSSRSPFAVIHHVGRRSGKPYETPVIVEPVNSGFVFALTYGPEVDWYRNVLAAGRGTSVWHGKEYAIEQPETLDPRIPVSRKTDIVTTWHPAFFQDEVCKRIGNCSNSQRPLTISVSVRLTCTAKPSVVAIQFPLSCLRRGGRLWGRILIESTDYQATPKDGVRLTRFC